MYVFFSFSVFAHALNIAFESTLDQRPTTSSLSVKSCLLHIFSANVLAPLIVMHFVTIKDLWHLFQIPYDQEQSLQRCSFKKMFWKFTGEHPYQSLISTIEITLWYWCCPVNLLRIYRTFFQKRHHWGTTLGDCFEKHASDY